MLDLAGLPVGVSVLCPGWVRTGIDDADRNWPAVLGDRPPPAPSAAVVEPHVRRAIDEGATPAYIADAVTDAVQAGRFWVIPQQEFLDLAVRRWHTIADRSDPTAFEQTPGMPPRDQIVAEVMATLGL